MQNPNVQNSPKRKARTTNELGPDFKFITELGSGAFGAVELFQYVGNDKNIKKLCNEKGKIGVKFQNVIDVNEANIGKKLLNHVKKHPKQTHAINLVMPFKKNGEIVAILTNPVFYNENKSANMESFLKKISANSGANDEQSRNPWTTAFNSGLSITLSQLASSMYAGQRVLHNAHVLHMDTSCRNYLMTAPQFDDNGNIVKVSAKISDYGISGEMSSGERTLDTNAIANKAPLRYMDYNSVANRTADISTDLMEFKATLLEQLGFIMGARQTYDVLFYPGYDNIIKARFYDGDNDPPYKDDGAALNIYLQNVINLLPNCPAQKRAEVELFLKCYAEYLTSLPKETLSYDQKKLEDKTLFIKANEKFIVESITDKQEILNQIETMQYAQYAHLEDKALIVNRLLAMSPLSENSKSSQSYLHLLNLHHKCQLLNQQFVTDKASKMVPIEQLSNLSEVQLQEQTQLIRKLLAVDVTNEYRETPIYQQLLSYKKNIQLLNERFINEALNSNSGTLNRPDSLNKIKTKDNSELIDKLLTREVSDDYRKSDSFKQLQHYQKQFHLMSNEQSIKEDIDTKLINLNQVYNLDKAKLAEQATLVNRLLATEVRDQFLKSDAYQTLLKYQEKLTLLYTEKYISEQLNKFQEKYPLKNEENFAIYSNLEQMYRRELLNIKNEIDNGNYINIKQTAKILLPLDTKIKEKMAERDAQLKGRDTLLSDYYKIEENIVGNLKKYKWAFNADSNPSNEQRVTAIHEIKEKFAMIRNQIKSGELTEMEPIKKILTESLHTLGDKFRATQQRTMLGKVGLSTSNTAEKIDESIAEIRQSPRNR